MALGKENKWSHLITLITYTGLPMMESSPFLAPLCFSLPSKSPEDRI